MKAVCIRIDDLNNPLGLGDPVPEISWNCEGGTRQTSYRIVARRLLKKGAPAGNDPEVIWDSGKVSSSSMTHIAWGGEKLGSRDIVDLLITLWDENGKEGEDSAAHFEMGLLSFQTETTGEWIGGDYRAAKNVRYPADCFRKAFRIATEPVLARLYATARGVYDVTVNGRRLDDFVLAPGMTDYRKRIQLQTYDVTNLLQQGKENTMELRLADGWYRGSVAAYGVTNVFGKETSVCAQLEITFADGSRQVIGTDETWEWYNDGPITFADLKDGEHYDARRHLSYGGHARKVTAPDPGKITIAPSNNVPVREHERFAAAIADGSEKGNRDDLVLDFGQNFAGFLEFTVHGAPGQKLSFLCGEVLGKNGHVDLSGIRERKPLKGWTQMGLIKKLLGKPVKGETVPTPEQTIHFTCSGGEDHYKMSFAVFGFRYVEIRTEDGSELPVLDPSKFAGIAVYSDLEETGDFRCSDEGVNQLVRNTRWSMKGNFLDVPTDCPTRERLGWTGDAQIFFNTGSYFMNIAPFFRKWLQDLRDDQYSNGTVSAVVPYSGVEMMYKATGVSVGWADAIYLIPYRYYRKYGSRKVLEASWPSMERYADYLMKHLGMTDRKKAKANPDNAYTYEKGVHLGEWLEPEEFRDKVYGAQAKHPEECTAYLYLTMTTMAETARILGKPEELQEKFLRYAAGAKKAYYDLFVQTGTLHTNRQAKLVRPLALGLLDDLEAAREEARNDLEKAVKAYDYRVGTGFLSTPFLLPELTKAGHADTAYRVLMGHMSPSWLSEVDAGATTVWENWEGNLSQNHYSPGAVCEWLFDTAAGIRVDGENHFDIAPVPDPSGKMTNVTAAYRSIYGEVTSSWKREQNGHYTFEISLPANTTASVTLPDGTKTEAGPGEYKYVNEFK